MKYLKLFEQFSGEFWEEMEFEDFDKVFELHKLEKISEGEIETLEKFFVTYDKEMPHIEVPTILEYDKDERWLKISINSGWDIGVGVIVYKYDDEYYYVEIHHIDYEGELERADTYYKCDQLDGLIKLFEQRL